MTKKINCKIIKPEKENIKVKLIRAPYVDNRDLKNFILARARAIVL